MANPPPFDRDPPLPGGFDPRFDPRGGPNPRVRRPADARRYGDDPDAALAHDADRFGRRQTPPPAVRRGMSGSTGLLLGLGLLLLLGAIAFALSLGRSGPGSDRLDGGSAGAVEEAAAIDPATRCAAPATYDRLKRELFRQAAALRGADQAAFDRLAGYAAIRVSGPVLREQDAGLERVSCGATVALDLPPGVAVAGGRRSLAASIGYSLQPAADGNGDVLTLSGADGIVTPLATASRIAAPPATASPPDASTIPVPPATPDPAGEASLPIARPQEPTEPALPPAPPAAERQTSSPSFNCARARTDGERAVCASEELAALDRGMASRYVSALRDANATQRALLQRTRDRFLAFRDRCGTDRCIADAYRGRVREIADIMADRWVPPR